MSEEKKYEPIPGLDMRYTEPSDAQYLKEWLMEPGVNRWFPMFDEVEIDDAVARWIAFCRYKCSLTATMNSLPCGLATLYLQPYRKLAHQCEFGIIVGKGYRNMGVGTDLIRNLVHLATSRFNIELLHLQVYSENPAIHLYKRMGFEIFGEQKHWIKEVEKGDNVYTGRIFMEKYLKKI